MALVYVVCGSKSDLEYGKECIKILDKLGIESRIFVASAHRSPDKVDEIVKKGEEEGIGVIIALAGFAAHLPGVIASKTIVPVIGVPINSSPLLGIDALLSIVQMPGGIPCAGVGIGKSGAQNGAILAGEILALQDSKIKEKLQEFRLEQKKAIEKANEELNQ
ncbi:MAG: 5-(carboxyamino)imidazole ribonucleotide mutase [Atribacterota bacterium]|jgi:phosphoribosylaminoimidazole carboxylase PurE protein|nr:5-(carboxyamino)imidazole ribonucleotide mutase [Atribacterota bacterium]MDI9607093.1 5-(carboxyamino)imidazole ribonucleotide mutase [Atribacterota bacterium]HOQ50915.1 5-(carboxyamino)imidazole ribonucleotide mutase [Candidatus Atribacteria bacterium]HPZ39959.1 5-(carboxyamino)imidazole ribonucleotide mutase [Candidatus Atribacteria bacterium]HQD33852.1 5-(carboxyamino)imidazole ribonucleotide mutase [Candidatus Atribacteria bacterium]